MGNEGKGGKDIPVNEVASSNFKKAKACWTSRARELWWRVHTVDIRMRFWRKSSRCLKEDAIVAVLG
jgi:hypothetical protein